LGYKSKGGEAVRKGQIARLARRIGQTQDVELNCGDCGERVPVLVDSILAGKEEFERWTLVRQHMDQCTVCAQEFSLLREVARMDLEDSWPSLAAMMEMVARHEMNA
jgi:hypothetical protein